MAKRTNADVNSGNPSNIRLNDVNPIWLEASPTERYLLLEDTETGDILMPLIYMKHVLVANYSRKLAALKNRLVTIPVAGPLANQQGLLYWQWAFESPHAVKVIVRQEIGEATPQGHLRLVLIPIVYNALVVQEDLRSSPLFHALHRAIRSSTYWPLLLPIEDGLLPQLDAAAGITGPLPNPLFCGPRLLEATAIKYMFMFKDKEEMNASKRNRTTGASNIDNGVLTSAIIRSGLTQTTNLMALVPQVGGQQRPGADAASMEAAAAAAMASATAMAAAAAAAAAANAGNEDEDNDDDDGGGGNAGGGDDYDDGDLGMGGDDDSQQPSLDGARNNNHNTNLQMPSSLQGNTTNANINGGQAPNSLDLSSLQGADLNFQMVEAAQMVEAMMQQQLQLQQQQQQQQQLPPLPPGLQQQQPMAAAMKQHALQQQFPSQMQTVVPHSNSFASLMRAAAGGNANGGGGGGGIVPNNNNNKGAGALIQNPLGLPALPTNISLGDIHTADAVRQLVDMKFQEVVRELMRLKSSMMQLYTAVVGVALQQGSLPDGLLGAGSYLSGAVNNGLNGLLSNGGGLLGIDGGIQNQNQQQQQIEQGMRMNGAVNNSGAQPDVVNNQGPSWPPLFGEIQQAGVLPQQGGTGNGSGGGTGNGVNNGNNTTAGGAPGGGAGVSGPNGNNTNNTMNAVFGQYNQMMGSPPSQEELNLAALNKNNTNNTNTAGDLFPSLSGLLNESYPKDGKLLGGSLSFRDHPSLSLPDLAGELQQAGGGGGGGGLPAGQAGGQQQQQGQENGNEMNNSPGAAVNAHQAAAWANAIGMSFPQHQGN